MSDIEDYGDDAIWVPATPEEIEATRRDAKESSARFDALYAEEVRNGTWKPLPPAPPSEYDDWDPPY